MTTPAAQHWIARPLAVGTSTEPGILAVFLDFQRSAARSKLSGVPTESAHRRLAPSGTSLAGVIAHLTEMERTWFHPALAPATPDDPPDPVSRPRQVPDQGWGVDPRTSTETLLAVYDRACAMSRDAVAGHALDDVITHPLVGAVSLRWIHAQMIIETARHAGHADILREHLDGTTGIHA